jgi:hypothetical protein
VLNQYSRMSCEFVGRTWKVDRAIVISINLVDHVLQFGLGRVLTKRSHDGTQLLGGDLSCLPIHQQLFHVYMPRW